MSFEPDYYFIRVNGDTAHNNPQKPRCYVQHEPPSFPVTSFNYFDYCLRHGVVRIGWPGVGDLRKLNEIPVSTPCYRTVDDHVRQYLDEFRQIRVGDVVLMPDKSRPGIVRVGDVTAGYHYHSDPPAHPFECAHRLKMRWDRTNLAAVEYDVRSFGISIVGGFWMWAFHRLDPNSKRAIINAIAATRHAGSGGA